MKKIKSLRILLRPGYVESRHDYDIHYISASQLMRLYNVLPTDIILSEDKNNLRSMPFDRLVKEGWIELWPRKNGDYWDVHQNPSL